MYQPPQSYYLALGDSIAYGFQPNKAKAPPSAFDTGYVDVFAARLRKLSPKIQVVNYGCPGESTMTFTRGGCDWLAHGGELHDAFRGSQLRGGEAVPAGSPREGESDHRDAVGRRPGSAVAERQACAQSRIASFASRLTSILEQLRAAAPTSEIIVTGAWNPEADRLAQVEPLYRSVDMAIARAATASRARVANMFAALNGPGTSGPSRLGSAGSPTTARRAIRIRPTPGTARWPTPS